MGLYVARSVTLARAGSGEVPWLTYARLACRASKPSAETRPRRAPAGPVDTC